MVCKKNPGNSFYLSINNSTLGKIAIGETSDGSLICLSLTMGGVIVLNETGASLAGSSFTDFLWRMRLETKNILTEEQQVSELFKILNSKYKLKK